MTHYYAIRKEGKHDRSHADQLSTTKPSVSHRNDSSVQVFGQGNKSSTTRNSRPRFNRAVNGGISAMNAYELGIKTTDIYGKERNWAILEFEAAYVRARDAQYAGYQQARSSTVPKQPFGVPHPPKEIELRLPEEGHSQKYTTWRKPEKKLATRRASPARLYPATPRSRKVKNKKLQNQEEHGYFSLPGEIRNMIMGYLIAPGTVSITSDEQPVNTNEDIILHASGWQFLATCSQAYLEGSHMYSLNEFHLAPGPLSASINCLKDWNPRFQGLIKNVTMHLSILDLTPAVLDRIGEAFEDNCCIPVTTGYYTRVAQYIRNGLQDLWLEKIAGVRETKTIERFTLVRMHLCEPDGSDDRHTQWPTDILTVHRDQNLCRLEGMDPSADCLKWGRASDDLMDPRLDPEDIEKENFITRFMLHLVLSQVESKVMTRLRNGSTPDGRGGWSSLKQWLTGLQVSTKEYAWGDCFIDVDGFHVHKFDWN